jgi:hypothetical protein
MFKSLFKQIRPSVVIYDITCSLMANKPTDNPFRINDVSTLDKNSSWRYSDVVNDK